MKISRHTILLFFVSFFIFIIPFFWLKPGEMDIGGDSSRLYFYDPVRYLFGSTLYSISASAFGLETIYYFNIPFVSLLIVLKAILGSSTLLISVFHGFSMSASFVFCYLIIKELIIGENSIGKSSRVNYAAILGGLTYILSPALIDGWEHVLWPHNQIFLNPLLFYLLLKYCKTTNINYIILTVILSFIFSSNFSVISAPAIFSFYPIAMLFLFFYTKFVIKRKIIVKHILLGFFLFLIVQSFHLIPHINNILTPGSDINSTVFSSEKKLIRGLGFFSAVAVNIKASINLLGFPQNKIFNIFTGIFAIFPFLIILSFILKRKKTILFTAFFFLVVLFFATANITNIWLEIYKVLFYIPGFSMFRNFYGQWQFVYIFFYSILFGQALYVILSKLSKKYTYFLLIFLTIILVTNAMPLLTSELVRRPLWQSKDVVEVMEMDPDYEKALSFIRFLPSDAKVLTLPMTDPGYQIVAGKNGGAYMGPSTIAYLTGKKDFAGIEEFDKYKDVILNLIQNKNFSELRRLLGIFNVKYIFYNADPRSYEYFPGYPYVYARKFLPIDQKGYKEFVKNIGFSEIKNINNKFFIFELQDSNYLPKIYVARKIEHFNKEFTEINVPLSLDDQESRIAVDNNYQAPTPDYRVKFDEILTDIQGKNYFLDFFVNADHSVGFPYAFSAWPVDSLIYPFVVFRENLQLHKPKKIDDIYIETAILIADKRIDELERWANRTPILGNVKSIAALNLSWREPSIWEALIKRNSYNAWEIGFLRYKRELYDLISRMEKPNNSVYSPTANKEKLKKAVVADRERFYTIIEKNEKLSKEKKIYLLKLCIGMFDSIMETLHSKIPLPQEVPYDLSNLETGEYEIFIEKKSVRDVDQSKWQIVVNGRKLYLKDFQQDDNWYKGQKINISAREKSLIFFSAQSTNLLSEDQWRLLQEKSLKDNYASLMVEDDSLPNSNGLIRQVNNWNPRSYYILSFEYLTHGKNFKVVAYDKSLKKNTNFRKIFEDNLRSKEWKSYETIFQSSNDANLGSLQILKSGGGIMDTIETKERNSEVEIKNFSLIMAPNPKIVLRKVLKSNPNSVFPKITFTKINSTKYKIDVRNAVVPYMLVFAEAFNSKWRLVDLDPKTNTESLRGYLSRFFASVGNMIGNVLRIEESRGNGIVNYFGGEVKENYSKNIFLDGNTFNAWGKNDIGSVHIEVNGYSNAWYIKPENVGGKTEYTLILEMGTQKLFYRSLVLSILTFILCVFLLVTKLSKHSDEK